MVAVKGSIDQILDDLKAKFPALGVDVPNFGEVLSSLLETLQLSSKKSFTFLLVGRTGVGKSSTINSLMGCEVALTNDFEPETIEVTPFTTEVNGIAFTVVDTPGLCDALSEENDQLYLMEMRVQAKKHQIDLMWFVTPLDEPRVRRDELDGLRLISESFGSEIWNHSVIIFTCADKVDPAKFSETLKKRTQLIRQSISKFSEVDVTAIPAVAVTNVQEATPDGKKWLGELYVQVLSRITSRGALPFFLATAERVALTVPNQGNTNNRDARKNTKTNHGGNSDQGSSKSSAGTSSQKTNSTDTGNGGKKIDLDEEQKERVRRIIDASIIPGLATLGATVGGAFGPVGAAIGGALGAAVGLVAWLWK